MVTCERCVNKSAAVRLDSCSTSLCGKCIKEVGFMFKGKWGKIKHHKKCRECRNQSPLNSRICERCGSNQFTGAVF